MEISYLPFMSCKFCFILFVFHKLNFLDLIFLISISSLTYLHFTLQNAAFVASSLGIDIVDNVNNALSDAGYNNLTAKEVMIQSSDSAVLVKLKQQKTKCKLVYTLPLGIGDASQSSLVDMKKFANAVVVERTSVFALSNDFIIRENSLVNDLQSVGLDVYAQVFRNEFVSQPWDFFGDATVEINNYVQSVNISGFITDFPKTVRRYKSKSSCSLKFSTWWNIVSSACIYSRGHDFWRIGLFDEFQHLLFFSN
jgi:hypothetical protein